MNIFNTYRPVMRFLRPYLGKMTIALILVVINIIFSVIEPFVLGLIMTEVTANVAAMVSGERNGLNYEYIFTVLAIYFVRGLIVQVTSYGSNFFLTQSVQFTTRDMRDALINKVNHLPVSYFDQRQIGDILSRITSDVETVANMMQQGVVQVFNAILTVTFVTIMMVSMNWQLALIVLGSMPLSYVVGSAVVKLSQKHFKQQADVLGRMNGFVQESYSGFDVIRLFSREDRSVEEFQEITAELADVGFKASFISGLLMPLVSVVENIAYLAVSLIGGWLAIMGRLTIGNLQAFLAYVWQINQPVRMVTQIIGLFQSASAAVQRIQYILNEDEEEDLATAQLPEIVEGRIDFDDVSFAYHADQPLIKHFTTNVNPGETIAIVGPTGAGKTTMINLLMRFYDVDSGSIRIDGIDQRSLSRQQYRKQFGMVLQDTWLFEGTVKENLRFGNLAATDEEIIEACKITNVDHFIRTLPGGYDMVLNQESNNISVGQKQLLTIARALISNPKILILDEATSSVDTRLEKLIQQAMDRLMQGRTSFVIAHRLSTILEADRILVMRDGQIIEQGNHQSLMQAKGFYYDLYQSQFAD